VALLLKKYGIEKVRPLEGGLGAWRGRGYPTSSTGDGPSRRFNP